MRILLAFAPSAASALRPHRSISSVRPIQVLQVQHRARNRLRRLVGCASKPPIIVEGDLVTVTGQSGEVWVGAVVGLSGSVARVLPVVRRSAGGDRGERVEEAFVDYSANETEAQVGAGDESVPARIVGVVDAEWSCRQMTINNPHGEAVEYAGTKLYSRLDTPCLQTTQILTDQIVALFLHFICLCMPLSLPTLRTIHG
jgi:hypothetical protein